MANKFNFLQNSKKRLHTNHILIQQSSLGKGCKTLKYTSKLHKNINKLT